MVSKELAIPEICTESVLTIKEVGKNYSHLFSTCLFQRSPQYLKNELAQLEKKARLHLVPYTVLYKSNKSRFPWHSSLKTSLNFSQKFRTSGKWKFMQVSKICKMSAKFVVVSKIHLPSCWPLILKNWKHSITIH